MAANALIWLNALTHRSKKFNESQVVPEIHPETHYNQTVEIQRQRILKAATENWLIT